MDTRPVWVPGSGLVGPAAVRGLARIMPGEDQAPFFLGEDVHGGVGRIDITAYG